LPTFARAFEAGEYFLAHEILEGFWAGYDGHDREFYQGLVQAAVALHHASRGNLDGARGVARSFRRRMEPFAPRHRGLDVVSFLSRLDDAVEGRAGPPSLAGWEQAG
jgi:predicted metal-dependent hydrolase